MSTPIDSGELEARAATAEFLASREVASAGALWFEFADELAAIGQRQLEWFWQDAQQSMSRLMQAEALPAVVADHMARRVNHALQGVSEASALLRREMERTGSLHRRLWAPLSGAEHADRR